MAWEPNYIDRAISTARYYLLGPVHPLGVRFKAGSSPKAYSYIPGNFIGWAAGEDYWGRFQDGFVNPFTCSVEECFAMCKLFASRCSDLQKDAISSSSSISSSGAKK